MTDDFDTTGLGEQIDETLADIRRVLDQEHSQWQFEWHLAYALPLTSAVPTIRTRKVTNVQHDYLSASVLRAPPKHAVHATFSDVGLMRTSINHSIKPFLMA